MSYYESVTTQWSSEPKGTVYGTRNIVTIKNGKGRKIKEALNKHGHVMERNTKTLQHNEMAHIRNGTFVPGLWSNCGLKCTRGKNTRKFPRRKPSQHIK